MKEKFIYKSLVSKKTDSLSLPPSILRSSGRLSTRSKRKENETSVVTVLTPGERASVDAAGEGCYTTLHKDSVDEVLYTLKTCRADGVLFSVARYDNNTTSAVARVVREFPHIPAVALLCDPDSNAAHSVLALGTCGIKSLVDVREPSGWRSLRQIFSDQDTKRIEKNAISRVDSELGNAPEDCKRFFHNCFLAPPRVTTVRRLSRRLGVTPSTLMSRFYRANLPAPKRYLSMARLVRAAARFENPGVSISQVAVSLEYSSPQSFGRHVNSILGLSAVSFRRNYNGALMMDRFMNDLINPYLSTLTAFHPLLVLPPASRVVEI